MTRPLRNRKAALLLPLEEVLHLLGMSAHRWRDLLAAEEAARQSGEVVANPLPRPVDLHGRRMWRRSDVERWVAGLKLRGD